MRAQKCSGCRQIFSECLPLLPRLVSAEEVTLMQELSHRDFTRALLCPTCWFAEMEKLDQKTLAHLTQSLLIALMSERRKQKMNREMKNIFDFAKDYERLTKPQTP